MNNNRTGVMLLVGLTALLTACGGGDVAPPPEAQRPEPQPRAEPAAAPAPTPTMPDDPSAARRDLASYELDKFLQVRETMFEVYRTKGVPFVLIRGLAGADSINPSASGDAELQAVLDKFNRARYLGLAEAGMHELDYARVKQVVYGQWWKATAGGQDIDRGIELQREMIQALDAKRNGPPLSDPERRLLEARRAMSEFRIANLFWTRTPGAAQALQRLPAGTREMCSGRAEEIRRLEMLSLQPYAELFSVNGLRPMSIAQR